MEKKILESCGEYTAYIIIGLVAFIKVLTTSWKSLKDFLNIGKKTEEIKKEFIIQSFSDDSKYFLYFLLEQNKILKALHDVKSDILKEQMDFFDKQLKAIKINYVTLICDMLNTAGIEKSNFSTYFSNSENFIDLCGYYIKSSYRQMCKDNHFSEHSPIEYRALIDKNIFLIDGIIDELLRKRYPQRQFIKDFDSKYQYLRSSLHDMLKACFEQARDVAIEKETIVYEAKENFEAEVSKATGMKYSLDLWK